MEDDRFDLYRFVNLEPAKYLSPRRLFDVMEAGDGTVSFIGMIEKIKDVEFPETVKGRRQVQSVVFTNGTDWKIQASFWDDDIKRLMCFCTMDNVVHVIGAYSSPRKPEYSDGDTPMDLTINDYTLINVIGKIPRAKTVVDGKIVFISIELEKILTAQSMTVRVEAYLKYNFTEEKKAYANIYVAIIASGKYKFEVRCKDQNVVGRFEIGAKLAINGTLMIKCMPFYLEIEKASDIITLEAEKISKKDLALAVYLPMKRASEGA